MPIKLDQKDLDILNALQRDAGQSQRELAERVGLSQNACWRRLKLLEEAGVIRGRKLLLDRDALGLSLVVFTMIRTRRHSADWLAQFRQHVATIPDIVDFYRIGGDYDYMLRIVTRDMKSFDRVYQRLIDKLDLDAVTSYFAMEAISEDRPLPL
ncbi:MAG: Lrp/AsnC family transcriptional regulator [Alphaproteobacteria bacterium]|nr:Lrp/AsnC family transcriptional regulator [Alphaproteobacteria bacterium]MDX5367901.1 Lrp/AsnC family transcriptional regulator [Alphaproteobacteria bacterium]